LAPVDVALAPVGVRCAIRSSSSRRRSRLWVVVAIIEQRRERTSAEDKKKPLLWSAQVLMSHESFDVVILWAEKYKMTGEVILVPPSLRL
jgi:hypothetical protein